MYHAVYIDNALFCFFHVSLTASGLMRIDRSSALVLSADLSDDSILQTPMKLTATLNDLIEKTLSYYEPKYEINKN